jgi:peptide chain release factor 1
MFERFADLDDKISHLEGRLSDPQLVSNQREYQKVVREHAHLTKLNDKYREVHEGAGGYPRQQGDPL